MGAGPCQDLSPPHCWECGGASPASPRGHAGTVTLAVWPSAELPAVTDEAQDGTLGLSDKNPTHKAPSS